MANRDPEPESQHEQIPEDYRAIYNSLASFQKVTPEIIKEEIIKDRKEGKRETVTLTTQDVGTITIDDLFGEK